METVLIIDHITMSNIETKPTLDYLKELEDPLCQYK